jgi:DNA-binding XRE family transcriptional regulator
VEHRKADVRQMVGYGASHDDTAQFLRELRQLRDSAGLSQAELAARAHYPYDVIRAAEDGPGLPDLPVLSAYVRGCGTTTEEWEERWRSLTRSPSLPVSAARQSGHSDAATAGARIGSTTQVGDGPDPSIIIAALNRVAEEMAVPNADAPAPPVDQPLPDLPTRSRPDLPSRSLPDLPSRSGAGPTSSPSLPGSLDLPGQPGADGKPIGWDPIRVSSAWPVLRDTPLVASDTRPAETAAGPWEAAPWATAPAAPAGRAAADSVGAAAARSAAGTRASGGAPAPANGPARFPAQLRNVVLIVALICVLIVLLVIFA